MKKICIVFPYSMGQQVLSGGVSKLVIENIKAVCKSYHTYLLLPSNNVAFKEYIEKEFPSVQVQLVDFDFISSYADTKNWITRISCVGKRTLKALTKRKNLIKAIRAIHPDIVHLHAEVCFIFLKQLKKYGYTLIFHTSSLRFADNKLFKQIVSRAADKYADAIVSPTKTIDGLYTNQTKYVLENPIVQTNIPQPLPADNQIVQDRRIKLIFTGRICRVKQLHYLIDIFSKLPALYARQLALYIVGKPNTPGDVAYEKELKEAISAKNIGNIYFLGYKPNVCDYLKYADIGVLFSISEAISMSCVEYMYSGLAMLGFDNPGINETVIDGQTGYLVKDGDVTACVEKLEYLVDNPGALNTLKTNARNYAVAHFSPDVFAKNILSIYQEVLDGARS